jgi:hypothetical protein
VFGQHGLLACALAAQRRQLPFHPSAVYGGLGLLVDIICSVNAFLGFGPGSSGDPPLAPGGSGTTGQLDAGRPRTVCITTPAIGPTPRQIEAARIQVQVDLVMTGIPKTPPSPDPDPSAAEEFTGYTNLLRGSGGRFVGATMVATDGVGGGEPDAIAPDEVDRLWAASFARIAF